METQAYLIGAAVVLISAVLIYLIAAFTMKEQSYDDILQEQRQRREAFNAANAADKKPKKAKEQKKMKKKAKPDRSEIMDGEDRVSDNRSSDSEQPAKMVELELEPDIIEDVPKPAKEPKHKGRKNRPILQNKDEKSPVTANLATAEAIHHMSTPKDVVELKRERENQERKKKEAKKSVEAESVRQEVIAPTQATFSEAPAPTREGKKPKKAREAQVAAAGEPALSQDGGHLMSAVQTSRLNDSDIQVLIDVLLSKQSSAGVIQRDDKWKTKSQKGDPVAALEKQMEEKEQLLRDERERAIGVTRRLKELQQELTREHHQYCLLEQTSQQKLQGKQDNIQALELRMQQTHEQHMAEVNELRLQTRKGQINDGQAVLLQRLTEENKQLQDKIANTSTQMKIVQEELRTQIQDRSSAEAARKSSENKCQHYEEKIHQLESNQRDSDNVLTQKYKELTEQYQREQTKNAVIVRDLDKANRDRHHCDQELSNMRNIIKDWQAQSAQKDGEITQLIARVQTLSENNSSLTTELTAVQASSVQDSQSQVDPQQELMLQDKMNELSQVSADVDAKSKQIEQLSQDLEASRKKNDELEAGRAQLVSQAASSSQECQVTRQEVDNLRRELSDAQGRLQEASSNSAATTEQNNALQQQVASLEASSSMAAAAAQDVSGLRQQLELLTQQLQSKEQMLDERTQKEEELQKQLEQAQDLDQKHAGQLQDNSKEVEQLSQQLRAKDDDLASKVSALQEKDSQLDARSQALQAKDEDLAKKISELQERDCQLDARNQALRDNESRLEQQAKELKEAQTNLDQRSHIIADKDKVIEEQARQLEEHSNDVPDEGAQQELFERISDLEGQLREGELQAGIRNSLEQQVEEYQRRVAQLDKANEALQEKNRQMTDALRSAEQIAQTSTQSSDSELVEAREVTGRLEAQVQHYKSVLADTESILNKLQSSVESEEQKWQQMLSKQKQQSQEELNKAQDENRKLSEEIKTLQTSSQAISEVPKVQVPKVQEVPKVLTVVDIHPVQKDLETALKQIKDLKAANVKLNGQLRMGQAAVKEEQETVDKLKKQLEFSGKGIANGAPANQEVEELQAKLMLTQHDLEREIETNQQLSRKLGVSAENDSSTV